MLPEIRTSSCIYSIPEFDLDRNDVEGFLGTLEGFHTEFRDCFAREEGRNNFLYYSIGQFSQMERKSIEPMALNVEGAKVRAIQHFISKATWDDENMMRVYRCMVNNDIRRNISSYDYGNSILEITKKISFGSFAPVGTTAIGGKAFFSIQNGSHLKQRILMLNKNRLEHLSKLKTGIIKTLLTFTILLFTSGIHFVGAANDFHKNITFVSSPSTIQGTQEDKTQLVEMLKQIQKSWEQRDAERLAGLYTLDTESIMSRAIVTEERLAIQRHYQKVFKKLPAGYHITILNTEISFFNQNAARIEVYSKQGTSQFDSLGYLSFITATKENNQWLISTLKVL